MAVNIVNGMKVDAAFSKPNLTQPIRAKNQQKLTSLNTAATQKIQLKSLLFHELGRLRILNTS